MNSLKASFDSQNSSLSNQISQLSQAISGLRSNNRITASIGLPPIAIWTVSALIGISALLFIWSSIEPLFSNDPVPSMSPNDNVYTAIELDSLEAIADSLDFE